MTDYERLKEEYLRDESMTLRTLAARHKINYSTLKSRAAKQGWAQQKRLQRQQAAAELSAQSEALRLQVQEKELLQKEKINAIAEKLLHNIEQGTELFEKPTHIATLTGALKELTGILRDVNEVPSQTQRRQYELSKRKLELQQCKLESKGEEAAQGGVVVLAEVKN